MRTSDYVDNKATLEAIKRWKARRELDPDAKPCDVIGRAILEIAHNLTRKHNFSRYTDDWKEKMIGDGIEVCVRYIKNFDTDKYSNPHTYITTMCYNAFVNRIMIEREESVAKYKFFVEEVFDADDADMSAQVDVEFYQEMITKIADYDESVRKSKKAKKDKKSKQKQTQTDSSGGLGFLYEYEEDQV